MWQELYVAEKQETKSGFPHQPVLSAVYPGVGERFCRCQLGKWLDFQATHGLSHILLSSSFLSLLFLSLLLSFPCLLASLFLYSPPAPRAILSWGWRWLLFLSPAMYSNRALTALFEEH